MHAEAWGDARLDAFERRFERSEERTDKRIGLVISRVEGIDRSYSERIGRLRSDIQAVQHELSEKGAVGRLKTSLEALMGDPISERRVRREAIIQMASGTVVGGSIVGIILWLIGAK